MKNKYLKITVVLLLFCGISSAQMPISKEQYYKLNQTVYAIKELYVDTVNDTKLVEYAISGILENLDPHSVYIPAQEVQRANEPLQGSFDGIGVKMQTSDIMKKLRGRRGTKVNVQVVRRGVKEPIDFVITRDKIPLYSVEVAYEIAPKVGYINISSFSVTTTKEFEKAFDGLKKKGITSLIIDLQSNGGGLMDAAINIVDEFLPKNKEILYTKGTHYPRQSFYSKSNSSFDGNVVVLIDEYSASASEIVSGALQDWDRAIVVGRRSFGKGLVQRPLSLADGSELRLTIARYYTPSGRNIQKPYSDGVEK